MSEAVRCWLVERSFGDQGLVTIVYATPDGERRRRFQWAAGSLDGRDVTAAKEFDPETLEATPDPDRERYATEATRMARRHDPDEEL
jgi:hypothetical protein